MPHNIEGLAAACSAGMARRRPRRRLKKDAESQDKVKYLDTRAAGQGYLGELVAATDVVERGRRKVQVICAHLSVRGPGTLTAIQWASLLLKDGVGPQRHG